MAGSLIIEQRTRPGDNPEQLIYETSLQTGCIPDPILDAQLSDVRTLLEDGQELLALTFKAQDDTLEIHLDPRVGYRYRFWERRMGARIFERRTAADYRTINRIPYPFTHETVRWNAKGEKVFQEHISVQIAKLNLAVNESDLSLTVPKASVTDLRDKYKSTLLLREPRVLTVATLLTLSDELETQSVEENAERIRKWQAERLRQGLPIDRSVNQEGAEETPGTKTAP